MEGVVSLSHIFVSVFLSYFAKYIVNSAITDVTMSALCPGEDECSLSIYLTGFQQAIVGVGAVVMMPIIGNLSDKYGRKTLLTFPMILSIIPLAILAFKRTTSYYYAYYVFKILTDIVSSGSVSCLAFAYLADNVSGRNRTAAFAILSGITSAALVTSTLAARFVSHAAAFQIAAGVSSAALIYMRIFLKESLPSVGDDLTEPILNSGQENPDNGEPPKKLTFFEKTPAVRDIIRMFKSSTTFTQIAVVTFFSYVSDGALEANLNYYLKAMFHFGKNQYAYIMLLLSVAEMLIQLILMPLLLPIIPEEKLLLIGSFSDFTCVFLNAIAWSSWVPYVAMGLGSFSIFRTACISSIASKQFGPHEQGKVQGCISSISSFANIIAPLIFSPLTALFLSDKAPFDFPGFSILCIAIAPMIAFIQSVFIRPNLPNPSHRISSDTDAVA